MPWLVMGLITILEYVLKYFGTRMVKTAGFFLLYSTILVAGYLAILASTYALINSLRPVTPLGVDFGLSILPPETGYYTTAYFTVLILKLVFDWQKMITKNFANVVLTK